jgi:tRNA nucleotidyltransferase (CCA-adding enzyme)
VDFPTTPEELGARLERALPERALAVLRRAASLAEERGWHLYLVGGYVRDLLLGRANYDIDVSVEGDAMALASALQSEIGARLEIADRFGTARLELGQNLPHLDLVTARRESYPAPGALPVVEAGDIYDDLARRDFTINAMAAGLAPQSTLAQQGILALLDPHGGRLDVGAGLIRVIHPNSFVDDPTRILRAVKYARRLGFRIDEGTLELALRAVRDGALATVSTDRLVRELLLIMEEPNASAMLADLERLGVLRAIHLDLAWPYDAGSSMAPAVTGLLPRQRRDTYLAILGAEYAAGPEQGEELARSLGLDAGLTRLVRDAGRLAGLWQRLEEEELSPSQVYNLLKGLDVNTLQAYARIRALEGTAVARQRLLDYVERLREVKPLLDGNYLRSLGVEPGPVYKRVLDALLAAKLDGKLPGRVDEEKFVREWLENEL